MLVIPSHRLDLSEAELQRLVLAWLPRVPGVTAWRANTGCARDRRTGRLVRFGHVGQADITGVLAPSGRRLEVELKAPRGRQSDAQRDFSALIAAAGGLYVLARSLGEALAPVCDAQGVPYELV